MAIIQTVIQGGGTTPTGTITITNNGTHDVTNYATADVQVPTTAPAHYIEKSVNANGMLIGGSTIINLNGVTEVGEYVLYNAYNRNTNISGVLNLSSLTKLTKLRSMNSCFIACTNITGVNLSSLTLVEQQACASMFQDCTGITSADLSSLTTIKTTGCINMFQGCNNLTNISIGNVRYISGGADSMFKQCSKLPSADLKSLVITDSTSACSSMFYGCTLLTSINLESLTYAVGNADFGSVCYGCLALPSISLYSLKVLGGNCFMSAFKNCTSLTSVYFYALNSTSFGSYVNQFNNMMQGVTGCTIHFPKNLDPQGGSTVISSLTGYPTFGGTNTVLAFDLPSTYVLTGADTVEYERNPKYDTAGALAWRVKDIGTTPNITIDWTPFYTSGTTDPVVNDTIYSDSACTTAVTTISAIA